MTNQPKLKEKKIEAQFFDELADWVDKMFPKGECSERGQALVLNAQANIIFRKLYQEAVESFAKEIRIPEWHKLSKESQEKVKVMTGYGTYEEVKRALNQKITQALERRGR